MNKIIKFFKKLFTRNKGVKEADLFKYFGKYKYTDEIKKIQQELEKSKNNY